MLSIRTWTKTGVCCTELNKDPIQSNQFGPTNFLRHQLSDLQLIGFIQTFLGEYFFIVNFVEHKDQTKIQIILDEKFTICREADEIYTK
jgi:hypothetical protein